VVDAATLRNNVAYELEPASSLSALVQVSDLLVTGTVAGWQKGRTIGPSGMRLFNATLVVDVDGPKTADGATANGAFPDGKAYVEVFLGTQSLDENGKPSEADDDPLLTRLRLDDVTAAAPAGARVILALVPARTTEQLAAQGEEILDAGDPLPDGAVLYMAQSQGFLLENADGSYDSGIADLSYFAADWPTPVTDPHGFATLLAQLDSRG